MKAKSGSKPIYHEASETKPAPVYRLLFRYLRSRLKGIALFLLCMLVFYLVCLLYQLENIPKLLYAFFLWAFIGFACGIRDFMIFVKRSRALHTALKNIENMQDLLPAPKSSIEQQYRQIIDMLLDERRNLLSRANFRDTDMTDYYTMWAHQIKVPIAAMRLLLQIAESRAAEENTEVHAKLSCTASDVEYNRLLSEELFRIEQYTEMVLYYQRLESINSDFLFREYDLRELVNQAVKKHSMFFINSRLSLNIEEFSCKVVTDEKWLQFVIGQVLSNALKYTPRGGIAIRLEKASESVPETAPINAPVNAPEAAPINTHVRASLIIEDTGIGIRPEDLPRIFERGFTGYNGRLDKKSTGIGLYLSKKILEKLSHTIKVTSEAGKGTRVAIGFVLTKM